MAELDNEDSTTADLNKELLMNELESEDSDDPQEPDVSHNEDPTAVAMNTELLMNELDSEDSDDSQDDDDLSNFIL
jgi:hypothetical protein